MTYIFQCVQDATGIKIKKWEQYLLVFIQLLRNTVYYNYQLKGKIMGNGQFQVPQHVNQQWEETFVGDRKYLRNKITLEMFEFKVLQKVAQTHNISQLIERSIYSIPKTPKIIILNDQICQLFILVQKFDQYLVEYLSKILLATDLLDLIRQIITVTECLFKKYGPFHITESMIGLNKNMEIIVWIHQQKQKNQVQFPLEKDEYSQQIMIEEIFQIIRKYSNISFCFEELKYNSNNFSNLNKKLPEMIKKSKMQMLRKLSGGQLRERRLSRALSPQNSFGSMRQYLIKSPKIVDNGSRVQKRNQIPKFLKAMKTKKNNLLDTLNHKRTMTIEEIEAYNSKNGGNNNFIQQKRDRSPSKSLAKMRSLKSSPRKDRGSNFSYGEMSKLSFPTSSNTQTYEYLTSSGSSSNYIIKKRDFNDIKTAKTCKILPLSAKVLKNNSNLTPSYTESKLLFQWYQVNEQSCIFQSFQKDQVQVNAKDYLQVNSKKPLGEMCANTAESKYFNEINKNKQIIVQEQSQSISKTLEDQFNDFFSSPTQSPRFILEGMPQSTELTQQFSKIIDF